MDCNSICFDDAVGVEHGNGCVDLCGSVSVLIYHMVGMCNDAEKQAIGSYQWRVLGIWSHRSSPSIRVS